MKQTKKTHFISIKQFRVKDDCIFCILRADDDDDESIER